jgi:membrane protease YdiL (CAAX protease family)
MSRFFTYPAHILFYEPAREKSELWRFAVGLVMFAAIYAALSLLFFQVMFSIAGSVPNLVRDIETGRTVLSMYLTLFSFVMMLISPAIVVRILHRRSALSLFGPLTVAIPQFFTVTVMLIALGLVVAILPPWDMGGPLVPNMPFGRWALFLPLSLLAVLVQVSGEEVFFRGYIQQQLAARYRTPWMWMVLPSLLFGLGHYIPAAAGENALTIAIWAGVFGLLMADLTARAGSIGPAIAVHFCNNVSAILIISMPDQLSGLALYLAPFGLEDAEMLGAWLPVDFAMMFVSWLAARLALRR